MRMVHTDVNPPRWIVYGAGAFDYMVEWLRYLRPAIIAIIIVLAIPCAGFYGCRLAKLIVPKAAQVLP